uniref:Uncharacterized protein n=1 Tax=Knipowitschia caucasica TaxID=637954 RepID=A0AAV2KB69_KNICA
MAVTSVMSSPAVPPTSATPPPIGHGLSVSAPHWLRCLSVPALVTDVGATLCSLCDRLGGHRGKAIFGFYQQYPRESDPLLTTAAAGSLVDSAPLKTSSAQASPNKKCVCVLERTTV